MRGKSLNFDDKTISESNFYKSKKVLKIDDIDINKILGSKKESYDTKYSSKYIIGYHDDDNVINYVKHSDSNKTMSFKVIDNKLLKNYNKIWEKISNLMKIEFDSEPVY